jgi:hypothetical protein
MQRRVFLTLAWPVALAPLSLGSSGCSKSFTCNDGTGLTPTDRTQREQFAYADRSSDIGKMCEDCIQFEPGDGCGKCKVLPGPVHPQGTCTLFASR